MIPIWLQPAGFRGAPPQQIANGADADIQRIAAVRIPFMSPEIMAHVRVTLDFTQRLIQQERYADALPSLRLLLHYPIMPQAISEVLCMMAKAEFVVKNYQAARIASIWALSIEQKPVFLGLYGLTEFAANDFPFRSAPALQLAVESELHQRALHSPAMQEALAHFQEEIAPQWGALLRKLGTFPNYVEAMAHLDRCFARVDASFKSIVALCKASLLYFVDWEAAKTILCTELNRAPNCPVTRMHLMTHLAIVCAATGNPLPAVQILNQLFGF